MDYNAQNSPYNDDLQIILITIIMGGAAALLVQQANARKRKWWTRPWLLNRGVNLDLPQVFMECGDNFSYKKFLRMDGVVFNKLLGKVEGLITKQDTNMRKCMSAKDKLIITLRYLATGDNYKSLMYNYRVHDSTISLFIPEVCRAIYQELKEEYLHVPTTTAEWLEISRDFEEQWNLLNILGALDGKHIVIRKLDGEGSAYFNYKGTNSIVLLAMVDANYNFTYVNIGTNGRLSDGGVFRESDLSSAINTNSLNFPEDRPLPSCNKPVPFVIAADAAFPLDTHIMKPFPFRGMSREQRIFNYRLSRVRGVVENVFGILASRFRVLLNTINLKPDKAKVVAQACVALHNYLRREMGTKYINQEMCAQLDKQFRFLYGLSKQGGNRSRVEVLQEREEFMRYVNGPGVVPWQEYMI